MLLISEIYRSILGESVQAGRLCTVVRLAGCHRRCTYCDSEYAYTCERRLTVDEVMSEVAVHETRLVLLTGGEPLLQAESFDLMAAMIATEHEVVLETSGTKGAHSLSRVPAGVSRIVDVKTPGSGIDEGEIAWDELSGLGPCDELKFVCVDRVDYEWSRDLIQTADRLPSAPVKTLSPVFNRLAAADLADWIVADGLDVRFQVQLHRYVWPERERGI